MKCTQLHIQNFRSIVDSEPIPLPSLIALVGANNAGKSNILRALDVFLTPGAGGVTESAFHDKTKPMTIEATFENLTTDEGKVFKQYLFKGQLILRKELSVETDARSGKAKVTTEYHGYLSKPKDWWFSAEAVIAKEGARPDWKKIAHDHGILTENIEGKVNKKSYEEGIQKTLAARDDIAFEEPQLGATEALGLQTNLLSRLPSFYLLPATADYSDEIDRRSTTTVFRRLMGELAERILKTDPRFAKVENALKTIQELFNETPVGDEVAGQAKPEARLKVLGEIEGSLKDQVKRLMPTVERVCLNVIVEEMKDFFSRGVTLKVDD